MDKKTEKGLVKVGSRSRSRWRDEGRLFRTFEGFTVHMPYMIFRHLLPREAHTPCD